MKVLQIIDSLEAGGAERMAVNIANELVSAHVESHLCTTRAEGLLKDIIKPEVGYLFAQKKGRIGHKAILKIKRYCKRHSIDILHAHGSSFFTAILVKIMHPKLKIVWHDHYGQMEQLAERNDFVLKNTSRFIDASIAVNDTLLHYAKTRLQVNHAIYLKNFAVLDGNVKLSSALPGIKEYRILCLANLRPQKDILNLLQAFKLWQTSHPSKKYELLLVGKDFQDDYSKSLKQFIADNALTNQVHVLGTRTDVNAILKEVAFGVLSSSSEGLPLALLEYNAANLPVICTRVGACAEVLKENDILVPPSDANAFANALNQMTLITKDIAISVNHVNLSQDKEIHDFIMKLKILYNKVL